MVYNWPSGTNVDFGPELASRLVDIDSVVALKDSTGNFEQFVADAHGRSSGARACSVRSCRAPATGC